ncbi:MAG: PucR family transcriptional regulator [Lachnospiraceae bacterium]|jgi:carbohydrate diacid regulator
MISNQIIQKSLDELRAITRIDLSVLDIDGKVAAATFAADDMPIDDIQEFVESMADSQVVQGYHFFKIYDDQVVEYVLVARGISEDAYMIGRVAVCQIQNLIVAYKERLDKSNFIQNLILDNLLLVDIYNRAKKLHIPTEVQRIVLLVETKYEKDQNAIEILKNLFIGRVNDFITAIDEKNIIVVRELDENDTYENVEAVCRMIVDMLNAEAMSSVRVAYGHVVNEIKDVSRSYKEAKMALDVGKIFYAERKVIGYNHLGIGRLIYQLPTQLCEMFMKEIFGGNNLPETLDDETLVTINKFFDNSLNISETSRQLFLHRNTLVYRLEKIQKITGLDVRVFDDALTFKIALMVANYMEFMKNQED